MLSRRLMNMGGAGVKNGALKFLFKKSWGSQREMPVVASKSFNELWRERNRK
jgi:L-lactate dehydrogenase complex protein LldF